MFLYYLIACYYLKFDVHFRGMENIVFEGQVWRLFQSQRLMPIVLKLLKMHVFVNKIIKAGFTVF